MTRRRGPTDDQLRRLKALRLEQGLSLDAVAERTGLPVAHVQALEEARVDELPAGPFVGAYYRLVKGALGGGEDDVENLPDPPPPPRFPLWAVRATAFLAVAGVLALAIWQVFSGHFDGAFSAAEGMVGGPAAEAPLQVVRLVPTREASFHVEVDGEEAFDGRLPRGDGRTFQGRDRIVVELSGAGDARIEYNGEPIRPQGRQGVPRRLVFIDDLSPDG